MNYGLWVIIICKYRLINKCTTLVEYVDNGGGYVCVGVGSIWEIFVHFSQSYYKPKMSLLKKKSLKKKYYLETLGRL